MIIHIELMALIKRPNSLPRVFSKEFNRELVVRTLLKDLGFSSREIRFLQVFISRDDRKPDAKRVSRSYPLKDHDKVFITMPIGGG
ncbi:MAG: hypothetical protein ACE5OZ_20650 [Candidatus Heimdallarchaeota archaeon]